MSLSLLLPDEKELQVTIKVKSGDTVNKTVVDIFDLELWFQEAATKSKETQMEWSDEFPAVFKEHTGLAIGKQQSLLLWTGVRNKITEVKKNLVESFSPSVKPESTSKPKVRKKRN